MSALATLLSAPQNSVGASAAVEWRVKVIASSDSTPLSLEANVNNWIVWQSTVTDTLFGSPVYMGSTGAGAGLRFHAMIPYGYFVPIPAP